MNNLKPMHPDFEQLLNTYDGELVALYKVLRYELLQLAPECNELLYNRSALTIAFSISDKLRDAFCHLPIYKSHINLGFNQGALLDDAHGILQGSGKTIRHIRMTKQEDFTQQTMALVTMALSLSQTKAPLSSVQGITISHLKN